MYKLYKNAGFESVTHPGYVPKIWRKQRKVLIDHKFFV